MEKVKHYIEVFKDLSNNSEGLISALSGVTELSNFEKNIVYTWLCPKPLRHMELPGVIMSSRGKHTEGFLKENETEILNILRAYRTPQYGRFMCHLLHTFVENEEGIDIETEPTENCHCGICGKTLYHYSEWENLCKMNAASKEQERREYLAFKNNQSDLHICIDCLIQLKGLHKIIQGIKGENYLLWGF